MYVPGYPGYLPWDIEIASSLPEKLRNSIDRDIAQISAMGANTIRFWGAPKYCYQSIKQAGNLFFLQTLWINTEGSDLHNPEFKEDTKSTLVSKVSQLRSLIFLGSLGSYYERTERLQMSVDFLGREAHVEEESITFAKRAAKLSKADLVTHLVYEFPELQGFAGAEYAKHDMMENLRDIDEIAAA